MVAEGDRLRPLQVGIAGHDGIRMRFRLAAQGSDQGMDAVPQRLALPAQVQPEIQRHLIVAAAGRVETPARVADAAGQLALDEGMDILRSIVDGEPAAGKILRNPAKPLRDGGGVLP